MAFVAEDGTGLANANSLCDVTFARTYFQDRGVVAWDAADVDLQRAALIKATDYVEGRWGAKFVGDQQYPGVQALSFPRLYIDSDGVVPVGVRKAVAEYALRALSAPLAADPKVDASGLKVISSTKKVGPIETATTYQPGAVQPFKPYPAADMLLRPFLPSMNGTYR
jgi:hypothetical protein